MTDTVYNPVTTKILADAAEHGSKTIGGKDAGLARCRSDSKLYRWPIEEATQRFFSDDRALR